VWTHPRLRWLRTPWRRTPRPGKPQRPARGPDVATRRGTPAPRYPASMQAVQLASRTSGLPLSAPTVSSFPSPLSCEPSPSRAGVRSPARHSCLSAQPRRLPIASTASLAPLLPSSAAAHWTSPRHRQPARPRRRRPQATTADGPGPPRRRRPSTTYQARDPPQIIPWRCKSALGPLTVELGRPDRRRRAPPAGRDPIAMIWFFPGFPVKDSRDPVVKGTFRVCAATSKNR
jgi:hypothetical protein